MKNLNKSLSFSIEKQYLFSTILLFGFITILYFIQDIIGYQTVSLLLLLIVFLLPFLNLGRGPIILSAVISALAWDYFFIPPHFTMHIAKAEDVVMFFMFSVVAITSAILTTHLKAQKNEMRKMERVSKSLYNLLKDLSGGSDLNDVTKKAIQQIYNVFGISSAIFYPSAQYKLKKEPHPASTFIPNEKEWFLAELSFRNRIETGKSTNTSPDANVICFPLGTADTIFGVIVLKINNYFNSEPREIEFLRNFIKEIGLFLEKYLDYSNP